MKPITDRDVVLDALTLCYEVENPYHYEELKKSKQMNTMSYMILNLNV